MTAASWFLGVLVLDSFLGVPTATYILCEAASWVCQPYSRFGHASSCIRFVRNIGRSISGVAADSSFACIWACQPLLCFWTWHWLLFFGCGRYCIMFGLDSGCIYLFSSGFCFCIALLFYHNPFLLISPPNYSSCLLQAWQMYTEAWIHCCSALRRLHHFQLWEQLDHFSVFPGQGFILFFGKGLTWSILIHGSDFLDVFPWRMAAMFMSATSPKSYYRSWSVCTTVGGPYFFDWGGCTDYLEQTLFVLAESPSPDWWILDLPGFHQGDPCITLFSRGHIEE